MGEIGSSYRFMHDRAYLKFESQNLRFALPVIVLSTITGAANLHKLHFQNHGNLMPFLRDF